MMNLSDTKIIHFSSLISACILLQVFSLQPLRAQHSFYLGYGPQKIIRHSSKGTFPIASISHYFQGSFIRQTSGSRHWEKYWKLPETGVDVIFIQLDQNKILGTATGLMPFVSFHLLDVSQIKVKFKLGTGMAYVDRPYHKINNPLNNAIGSYLNNITQFNFHADGRLSRSFDATFGFQLTHLSNSKTSTPNLGINMLGLQAGLRYNLKYIDSQRIHTIDTLRIKRRNGVDFLAGYGISEYSFSGGPAYGCYLINAGWYHHFSPFLSLIVGGSYEYNRSVFQFYYQDFVEAPIAHQKATKLSGFSALQMRFDKLALRFYTGLYLPYPANRERVSSHYFMLQLQYFPLGRSSIVSPFMGITMKSHAQVAQYAALVAGFQW